MPSSPARVNGDALRQARERAGLNQLAAAAALGIGRHSLWRWETGRAVPSLDSIRHMAEAYGVAVVDLLDQDSPATGSTPLRELRISAGMIQREAAALLGISQGHLSEIEAGAYRMPEEWAAILAEAYGSSPAAVAAAARETWQTRRNEM